MLDIAAIFLVLTALIAYVNLRFLKLPTTIGVMAISLGFTLLLVGLNSLGFAELTRSYEEDLLRSIDFTDVLLQGMLSLLLFAGALHVDLSELRSYRWQIGALAVVGTLLSTFIVGFGLWWALPFVGLPLPLMTCLLFGALIAPTDPIAVMGILKSAGAPANLGTVIAGESLFNDGIAVVIFSVLLGVAASGDAPSLGEVSLLLLHEAGGGLLLGLVLGWITFRLLRSIDHYQTEVLITLAMVLGGYGLANKLGASGPLAMVVAGLSVGNHGRALAMSDTTRRYVDGFWELIDEILNSVLFVLIGMEVLLVDFNRSIFQGAALAILVTLAARWALVGVPFGFFNQRLRLPTNSGRVLVWGGLRGGISVALALSLPASDSRDTVVALTYCVVVFSILVQGLSIGTLVRRTIHCEG
jgi:CPA1 family monovalent cation:H+ antiporter